MTRCSASCGGGVVRQAREVLSESSRGMLDSNHWRWMAKLNKDCHGGMIYTHIYIYNLYNIIISIFSNRFAAGYAIFFARV